MTNLPELDAALASLDTTDGPALVMMKVGHHYCFGLRNMTPGLVETVADCLLRSAKDEKWLALSTTGWVTADFGPARQTYPITPM